VSEIERCRQKYEDTTNNTSKIYELENKWKARVRG
jgi:hypothetical protein